jgi:hypothetical protein
MSQRKPTRLEQLRALLSSDDALGAVREAIDEDNREQQVVVWVYACILETNSAGLSIVFDRFDDEEVAIMANGLEAIGAERTLSDLRALQAALARAVGLGRTRREAADEIATMAEGRGGRSNAQVDEMEQQLLAFCRAHVESLAVSQRT